MLLSDCLKQLLLNMTFLKIYPLVCYRIYLYFFFIYIYAYSSLLALKRMIYSRVNEYSGRILLPQNDKIRMYVIV